MTSKAEAYEAFQNLLAELPAEFCYDEPDISRCRESFAVIKKRNVMSVWTALHTIGEYLDEVCFLNQGDSHEDDTKPL